MKSLRVAILCAVFSSAAFPQLTTEQKLLDFQQMAAVFAKQYAPYDWKVRTAGFDLFDLKPWLDRVRATKDDLEFADLVYRYTASLRDGHVQPTLPSTFQAYLGFTVDIYENRFLIDEVDRRFLPAARFPFVVGDEFISLDGLTAEQWMDRLSHYAEAGNPRSTRRFAADYITFRLQAINPFAGRIPQRSTLVVRRQNGDTETYEIPWLRFGTAIENFGQVPNLRSSSRQTVAEPEEIRNAPEYKKLLLRLQQAKFNRTDYHTVRGFGDPVPYYRLPAGFQIRLGRSLADFYVSGVYQSGGFRIGYIRIADFDASQQALLQFATEIAFFEANTDGIVVDVSRNPGGNACFVQALLRYLIPTRFPTIGFQLRATANWVAAYSAALENARAFGGDPVTISLYEMHLDAIKKALAENRGVTGPLPICSAASEENPAVDRTGRYLGYTRPIVVLTDELSASGADAFPATLQDTDRATIFGLRTMGLGGVLFATLTPLTTFSEIDSGITLGMMVRSRDVVTSEFPTVPFIENVGVRPHAYYDYMTRENLLQQGTPFVNAFTEAIVTAIRSSR